MRLVYEGKRKIWRYFYKRKGKTYERLIMHVPKAELKKYADKEVYVQIYAFD